MQAYIIRRLLLIIPTLFLVTLIVFFAVRFIPGDAIEQMLAEAEITIEQQEISEKELRHALGLDVPVHVQYGRWIGIVPKPEEGFSGIFQGDLGNSLWSGQPVIDEIVHRWPITLEIGILSIIISISMGIPIGIYSAIRQDTPSDYTGRTIAILAISLPSFWLGTMVTVYPSIWWNWSPPLTYIPLVEDPLANLRQFLLPAAIMGMHSSGTVMRMTRTMMLEVLRQDYIRTAWAKGLRERTIIFRHALKNALIPVVTLIGMSVPLLIGGVVVMESIFNLPGMGRLMIGALGSRDYPVISAINLLVASVILGVNLLVDLSYAYLDPRVSYR
ncbi:ABC transporter permease [Chloroflexota bacterium]